MRYPFVQFVAGIDVGRAFQLLLGTCLGAGLAHCYTERIKTWDRGALTSPPICTLPPTTTPLTLKLTSILAHTSTDIAYPSENTNDTTIVGLGGKQHIIMYGTHRPSSTQCSLAAWEGREGCSSGYQCSPGVGKKVCECESDLPNTHK